MSLFSALKAGAGGQSGGGGERRALLLLLLWSSVKPICDLYTEGGYNR